MNILAIDTSSATASAAVMKDGVLAGEYNICNGKTHSQIIMPMIIDVLKKSGVSLNEIDVFSVALGPGSFTGLRIGVATAKTFAQANNKPIIGISSLESLSSNVCGYNDFCIAPIIDARRGNVYNAIFKNGVRMVEDRLISLEQLLIELDNEKTVFIGDGAIKHKDKIQCTMGDKAVFLPEHFTLQKASSLAYLSAIRAAENNFDDLYTVNPIYVRSSQAERELNGIRD